MHKLWYGVMVGLLRIIFLHNSFWYGWPAYFVARVKTEELYIQAFSFIFVTNLYTTKDSESNVWFIWQYWKYQAKTNSSIGRESVNGNRYLLLITHAMPVCGCR